MSIGTAVAAARGAAAVTDATGSVKEHANALSQWWAEDVKPVTKAKGCAFLAALFLTLVFALGIAQAVGFPKTASRQRESVVVFTDGDVDDLLALHMLFRRSDVVVPLIVVTPTGLASAQAALRNVDQFVQLAAAQRSGGAAPIQTRIVLGTGVARRDRGSSPPWADDFSGRCSYARFARSSVTVAVGAAALYGQSTRLQQLTSPPASSSARRRRFAVPRSTSLLSAFAYAANGAVQSRAKLTLLVLSPMTDVSLLLDQMPPALVSAAIKIVVVAGGRFGTGQSVADAAIFTRDDNHATGSSAELNMFLDPESSDSVLGTYGGTLVPTVIVPVDVGGSIAAYVDYDDQWAQLASKSRNANDNVRSFLAALLTSYSQFEGPTLFQFKGTPKSVAAAAVLLDRSVRHGLYTLKRPTGVLSWNVAMQLGVSEAVGRSGGRSAAGAADRGKVDVVAGFATGVTSRIFLDSYLRMTALTWP